MKDPFAVPKPMQERYDVIVALTDAFCRERLDEEFGTLARKMAAALARKRPSPLLSGKPNSWACGIVYAVGRVNFVFDSTQPFHLSADEICQGFGLAKSTGGNKAAQILEMLKTGYFDATFQRQELIAKNPMLWMIEVNGLIIDARRAPREVQEIAWEKGFIPFLPEREEA